VVCFGLVVTLMKMVAFALGVVVVGGSWAAGAQDQQGAPVAPGAGVQDCLTVPEEKGATLPEDGRIEKNVYINDFYGVRYELPDGWHVDTETLRYIFDQKSRRANPPGPQEAQPYANWQGVQCSHTLLAVSRDPEKMPVWSAANQWGTPHISLTIVDHEFRPLVLDSPGKIRPRVPSGYTFGGQSFSRTDATSSSPTYSDQETKTLVPGGKMMYSALLTAMQNGHRVSFRISAESAQQREDLIQSLNSLQFK
jgi:hypothetical protein